MGVPFELFCVVELQKSVCRFHWEEEEEEEEVKPETARVSSQLEQEER